MTYDHDDHHPHHDHRHHHDGLGHLNDEHDGHLHDDQEW